MACTWASAFSPEKSSQIFRWALFCDDSVLARSQAASSSSATKKKVDRALRRSMLKECRRSRDSFVMARGALDPPLLGRQSEGAEDALQIIIAIILDLNSPAFLPVVERYPRTEVFLQAALQVIDGRGGK
jgi:hypothetical protein